MNFLKTKCAEETSSRHVCQPRRKSNKTKKNCLRNKPFYLSGSGVPDDFKITDPIFAINFIDLSALLSKNCTAGANIYLHQKFMGSSKVKAMHFLILLSCERFDPIYIWCGHVSLFRPRHTYQIPYLSF